MHTPLRMTFFDTPGRLADEAVGKQHALVGSLPYVTDLIEGMALPALLLNCQRQIVFANSTARAAFQDDEQPLIGRRIGEATDCIHAADPPAGCGTALACAKCGAAHALQSARLDLRHVTEECRIQTRTVTKTGSYNLKVTVAPFQAASEQLFLVTMENVFSEHRQQLLERMFFHDVLNAAGGLQGLLTTWTELSPEETAEYSTIAAEAATSLVEEIEAYRDMAAAERGELVAHGRAVRGRDLLLLAQGLYQKHTVATGKHIELRTPELDPGFHTDPVILKRVIGNLVKNALEASRPGQTVVVSYGYDEGPHFEVHNEAVMPMSVQLQVFQRSFSTKARQGRGLGTYGARLLTEQYLKGTIRFESRDGLGTVFTVDLPPTFGD